MSEETEKEGVVIDVTPEPEAAADKPEAPQQDSQHEKQPAAAKVFPLATPR